MKRIKNFLKPLCVRIWFIVTVVILIIAIVADCVILNYIPGVFDSLFGGTRSSAAGGGGNEYYVASEGITDKTTAQAAGNDLVEEICEEGFVLLKNEDNALPLQKGLKISVFGKNSVNLAYGSSGSVASDTEGAATIYESLESAGFTYNPTLKAFYENNSASGSGRPDSPSMSSGSIVTGFATGETPVSSYTADVKNSISNYSDVGLVVITRTSGENYDLPTTMKDSDGSAIDGAMSADDHYLELDENEQEMLKLACEYCDKVVLIINSSTPLELGFLDSADDGDSTVINYDFAANVQAALWIGMPGYAGINALGRILNGDVNPSGSVVDTYARDFMAIPAVINFSCNGEVNSDSYSNASSYYYIDYEEGIYVGYRYFETRGYTDGEEWYEENVVYPFGYGLSYTTFEWEVTNKSDVESQKITKDAEFTVEVKVTNTGSYKGKDTVQLYVTAPYTDGGIEKSHKVLVAYAKTDLIEPGESDTVELTFDAYDFASYDYSDANGNGFCGYELEKGEYIFSVSENAHDVVQEISVAAEVNVLYTTDSTTGYTVENRFSDADDQLGSELSRSDWDGTYPEARDSSEKVLSSADKEAFDSTDSHSTLTEEDVAEINASRTPAKSKSSNGLQLYDLIDTENYQVGNARITYDADNELWDQLVSRLTLSTCWSVVSSGNFKTDAIDYISKLKTIDTDGPSGYVNFMDSGLIEDTVFYCCECVLSSTWNVDLAYEFGQSIGDEGLIGASDGTTYSGLYAPGVNLHRTPFGGRNAEYYSEDSYLSGTMAAYAVQGAASRGVYMVVKHFAANDQETHRGGVSTWLTEQSYRELYLKSFEIAVKDGGATAVMSSFNRVGTTWTGGDYRLITEVLRNEWGFDGFVITDFASGQSHMNIEQMLYAGGDLWLDTITPTSFYDSNDALDVYVLQNAMKHILYTVGNSNSMNGLGEGVIVTVHMAYWRIVLIAINVTVFAGLAVWGTVIIIKTRKRKKAENIKESDQMKKLE